MKFRPNVEALELRDNPVGPVPYPYPFDPPRNPPIPGEPGGPPLPAPTQPPPTMPPTTPPPSNPGGIGDGEP